MMKSRLSLALMLLGLCPAWLAAAENLLPNPSFEKGSESVASGWRLDFWQPQGQPRSWGGVSDSVAHSGNRAVYMAGTGPGSHAYWSCRDLPAQAGKRYVFSAWVRPHGTISPRSRCQIHVGFQDAKGQIIQDKDHPFYSGWAWTSLYGYSDWVPLGVEVMSPSGSVRMSLTLRFVGVGEAWFDDVALVQSDTAVVPKTPPDVCRGGAVEVPSVAYGDTKVSLEIENPYESALSDLLIAVSGPDGIGGGSQGGVEIQPGADMDVPITVSFPRDLTKRDARVLLTGRYRLGGQERLAQWLVRFAVISADLAEAISEQKWGVSEAPASKSARPLEILGTILTRDGEPQYVSNFATLNLKADDGLAVVCRLSGRGQATGQLDLAWECLDYFFRPATGRIHVDVPEGKSYLAKIDLPEKQVTRIFRSGSEGTGDSFRVLCRLLKGEQEVASGQHDLRLKPALPRNPTLKPLAGRTDRLPVFGKLKLIDEVVCGDPNDLHAMRQGGKGLYTKYTSEPLDYYGGSKRLTYDWWLSYRDSREQFTRVQTILGRSCRVAENWGWFAYRMGRGLVAPGKHYVLGIEYPQDVSRNFLIWNGLDSRASFGFHTGAALGDPHARQRFMQKIDLPLSGEYDRHYSLMTALSPEGWIAIHSLGKVAAPFSHGVAVHAIRLYELGDREALERLEPTVNEPQGLPRRLIGFVSEDARPVADKMGRYRFWGMNMYGPLTLSYCGGSYETNSGFIDWPSKLFGPDNLKNPHALARPGYYRFGTGATEGVLAEGDRTGMAILPVLEYGGTGQLPPEALAVWPDGSPHHYHWGTTTGKDGLRTTRYLKDGTCIDMAHPAVGEDLSKLLMELADLYAAKHNSFGGMILTHRFQAWQISYSDFELRRFAKEHRIELPKKNAGQWVFANHRQAFRQWHYEKKRGNLLRATEALRKVRPDLRLLILNYNGGDDNLHFGTPLYWWDKEKGDELLVPGAVSLPDVDELDFAHMIEDYTRLDIEGLSVGMNPALYSRDEGICNLAIAHYPFLCGNSDYLNHFRTGEGSAICFWWIYNEDAHRNHPQIGWNCPGLHGNEPAGRYCVLDEVLAMAASDPFIMGVRIGSMNRGFPQYAREFAAAYRALPAVASKTVPACDAPEVVVRRYDTPKGTYLAVINTGLGPQAKVVSLKASAIGGRVARNLVTGKTLQSENDIRITLPPVSLTALRIEAK